MARTTGQAPLGSHQFEADGVDFFLRASCDVLLGHRAHLRLKSGRFD
jgi:hypothetical protein